MKRIAYIVIVVGVLLGCGERREYREALSRAEAVMNDHPDSALLILDAMNTEKKSWSKSLRMRFELMKAKAQNKAFVKFTSDSVMKDVVAYYDGWGESPNDRLLANYLLGCIYRDLNETSHAIDCFHDAITKADTTAGNCDYITLSRVYSQMAGMYHRQLLFSNEVDTRKLASYYASLANDSINAVFELGKIAGVYITLNKKDSAEILLKETINNCRRFGLTQDAILFSTSLMYLYIDQPEHLSDLKDLIDQYETETTLFDKHHNLPASKRIFFYYKGNYYENVNNLDTAEYYYRKIWRPDMSYASKVPMYKGLMNVYGKRHQTDSLFKYAQLYAEANDSSMISKDQQQTAQLSASYNYRHYKRLMLENERNAYKNGVIAIICLASLVITIMVGIYVSKKYREIQKKLTQIIERLKAENDTFRSKERNTDIDHLEDFLESNIAQLFIKKAKGKTGRPIPSDAEWRLLESQFIKDMPNTFKSFGEGKTLSQLEQRICVLLILDISEKTISTMTDSVASTISNAKARANDKLFGKKEAHSLKTNLIYTLRHS